jgi:DNA polymerase
VTARSHALEDPLPSDRSLPALAAAAKRCRACPLWKDATQTVFGQGPPDARVVLVGEQPGDREDRTGAPFVGPAGALLDEAMEEAGLDRSLVYVTNAVKHFKFEPRGKWRIHKKPNAREIAACRPWLEAELAALQPFAVVLLGATAAQSLLGPSARVGTSAHPVEAPFAKFVLTTLHPAAVLRAGTDEARAAGRARLVHDLRTVARKMEKKDD